MTGAHFRPRSARHGLSWRARRVGALVLTVTALQPAVWAYAAWQAGGAGSGTATATSVGSGNVPTAAVAGKNVTLTWSASTVGPTTASGYVVRRYDTSNAAYTIQSNCTGTVAALTCTEDNVPEGTWKWTVQPRHGANWTGPESAASASTTVAGYSPVALGARHYYRFGEGSCPLNGQAADSSGNNFHATYKSSGLTCGQAGALVGDANTAVFSNGSATVASRVWNNDQIGGQQAQPSNQLPYSVEVWFKTSVGSTGDMPLVSWAQGQRVDWLGVQGGSNVRFTTSGANGMSSVTTEALGVAYNDGAWHHMVKTFSGSQLKIYLDGVLRVNVTGAPDVNSASELYIGGSLGSISGLKFTGSLDELAVYHGTVLSAAQVTQQYQAAGY